MNGSPNPQVSAVGAPCPALSLGVPGLTARASSELSAQLDSVMAFADYCEFLTDGRLAEAAEQLVDLAQQMISAVTLTDLPDHVPRPPFAECDQDERTPRSRSRGRAETRTGRAALGEPRPDASRS